MAKPVESVVKSILAKNGRNAKLLAAVEYGWARTKVHPDYLNFRRTSTRAALVWEGSVAKAIELLNGDRGVHVDRHHDTVSFIFDQLVLVRLKKADVRLRTRNYPTLLAEAFHEPAVDLFGYGEVQRVEIVHVLNHYATEVAWVGVVARDGGKIIWNFELAKEEIRPMVLRPARPKKSTATLAKLKGTRAADKKKKSGE